MKIFYFIIPFLFLVSCKESNSKLTKITAKTISVDSTLVPSAAIDSLIAPYRAELTAEMQQVLSYTPQDLVKNDGELQSSMGNLMADLSIEVANPIFEELTDSEIDFVLFNHGGIRASIPEGPVTREHAFQVMPFENELVVVDLSGEKITELVDYFIDRKRAHPLSKNVELSIEGDGYIFKINGEDFDASQSYAVLTTDYLQGGGDRMYFLGEPERLTKLDLKLRDALLIYFESTDTLKVELDNRVIVKP